MLESVCKGVYEGLFNFLVSHINREASARGKGGLRPRLRGGWYGLRPCSPPEAVEASPGGEGPYSD